MENNKMSGNEAFWVSRLALFEKLYDSQLKKYESMRKPIKITLVGGKTLQAESYFTTPLDIAKQISNSLSDKAIVAKANDQLWDLGRPFEGDCTLEFLDWEDKDAQQVFWHSSAHMLGYALEHVLNCKLSVGPPLEEGGFFYEGETQRPVLETDYPAIEAAAKELAKGKNPYLRLVLSKEDALEMFKYSPYKCKMLAEKVADGSTCSVYRCGNLVDPCRGPHVIDTGRIKAFSVTKNSSSYFEGKAENASLQRIYGISFPQDKLLKEWKINQEEASKRDHRVIGTQQNLFGFHEYSPGSGFFMPHGTRIYNKMIAFMQKQYKKRGFIEVLTPNIYSSKLWMISGHWDHYKDSMFRTGTGSEADGEFGLKPMNCPGHCLLYLMRPKSYKDLPMRMAEFGVLHRNELTGALSGLTRVRRFQQDDAHIFCRLDQVEDEMVNALNFLSDAYKILGFQKYIKLSTMPEGALGSRKLWDIAEDKLARGLNSFCKIPNEIPDPFDEGAFFKYDGTPESVKKYKVYAKRRQETEGNKCDISSELMWELNPGDGAFYGPKIDIQIEDALKRKHQLGTVQLDFNLPQRFGLKYILPNNNTDDYAIDYGDDDKPIEAAAALPPSGKKADQKDEVMPYVDRSLNPNEARPVMIHRAIFGSIERCIAILCEHWGGKWPFWISPRQAVIIPITKGAENYAQSVYQQLWDADFYVDIDDSNATLEKKIRNSQIAQYNFILVCGEKEQAEGLVDVRTRDNVRHGQKKVDEILEWMKELTESYSSDL